MARPAVVGLAGTPQANRNAWLLHNRSQLLCWADITDACNALGSSEWLCHALLLRLLLLLFAR